MQDRRQHHTRGSKEPKTVEEFIADFASYLRGCRNEYDHDLKVTTNPIKRAKLEGQKVACKVMLTYLKDAKKQFKGKE
jgi:hypothetical protein